jgi:hypothetical protein
MKRFVTGQARTQTTLFPVCPEDFIDEVNLVRVIEAVVEALDLRVLGFKRFDPCVTGRPGVLMMSTAIQVRELNFPQLVALAA